ncbi:hypothetical protein [Chitinimonas lacunae]|uniref:Uncharacterized protein n=1 Tax=Chitinimonas lacunae TaxID=1963018 RepID=A0ABV8MP70_9NEIS
MHHKLTFRPALALLLACSLSLPVAADPPHAGPVTRAAQILQEDESLQSAIRRKRPPGPILVAIGSALLFGVPEATGLPRACSPQLRVVNFSNAAISDIAFSIHFFTRKDERSVGSTVTNFIKVPVQGSVFRYFYQLDTDQCIGLKGQVKVIHCVYADGRDCGPDIRPVDGGAIPLYRQD